MENILFTVMFSVLFGMLGVLIGVLFVEPFGVKGRARLKVQFVAAVVVAMLWFVLPTSYFGTEMFFDRWNAPFAVSTFCAIPAGILIAAFIAFVTLPARIQKYLAMVPQVAPVGLRNFKLLDVDEDGVVSSGDLGHAQQQIGPFSDADLKVLKFMQDYIGQIGHGVGSYTTYNATTKTSSSTTVCVISPRDLETFEAKINEQYSAWRQ